jgi:peptidoglycan hydrolase-like protein with peptidoglycan-binding domain
MLDRLRTQVAGALGITRLVQPPRWPLLRVADKGVPVQAAQHLLRASGTPAPVHGQFDRDTADAVRSFQRHHGIEVTGMIGGESWPLLARPVRVGQDGDAGRAVRLLAARRTGHDAAAPAVVDQRSWQTLLS